MLSAIRQSNGESALAFSESKSNGPFVCPECDGEVVLRTGSVRVNHFSHRTPTTCDYATGESDAHRRCKMEIYEALLREPGVTQVLLERSLGTARPDIFALINGIPVAIEVQISALTMGAIIRRTEEYARKGIYVLWLPQWTPYLDGIRYSPRLWEKWIHAAYFGHIYYWIEGLKVASYRFEAHFKHIPRAAWDSEGGDAMTARAHTRSSKRARSPVRGKTLNLARDFTPSDRKCWKGPNMTIPTAKFFIGL